MTINWLFQPVVLRMLPPNGPVAWLVWVFLLVLTVWLIFRRTPVWRDWDRQQWIALAALALITPLSLIVFTIRLPAADALPIPGIAAPALGPLLPLFGALPWIIASALFGSLPGAILAGLSGFFLALWDTRSPFTPLEFALVAALFGELLRQRYRTPFFGALRRTWLAGLSVALFYPLLYVATSFFWVAENFVTSLDFALSRVALVALAFASQLVIASVLVEVLRFRSPLLAAVETNNQPSPGERSLHGRLVAILGPILAVLFIALGLVVWVMAGRAATRMHTDRMQSSSQVAAAGVPFMLETGQNLMLQMASDPVLRQADTNTVQSFLTDRLDAVPYFEQVVFLDSSGNPIAVAPAAALPALSLSPRELEAVGRAAGGVPIQFFSVAPADTESESAQLVFVAAVDTGAGVQRVLMGRTRLASNPFAQPVLQSLAGLTEIGGRGLLLDGQGNIVYQPGGSSLFTVYTGQVSSESIQYEDIGPEGARRLVYYHPATGSNWAVVAQLPLGLVQENALSIALPALALLLGLALLAYWLLLAGLRTVTGSLQDLVVESQRIAAGDLDAPLSFKGVDEIGRLGSALEQMRSTLRARLGEIQRLLSVTQGVASSPDVASQVNPILNAALANGASMARLVFLEERSSEFGGHEFVGYGQGTNHEAFAALDAQVFGLTQTQQRVLLTNPARARLDFDSVKPAPAALAAFALKNDDESLGALWLTYDAPQQFGREAVRYLSTLAEQAAQAAANARRYLSADVGRKRMEALLAATPDPILLVDRLGRILLANPGVLSILGRQSEAVLGKRIEEVIEKEGWLTLFDSPMEEAASTELQLDDGRIFYVSLSPIETDGEVAARACILREVTQFKQAEAMRAEFLSTVSHELHDPLELIGGYVTMLDMVGELNEKQVAYMDKIRHSVDGMSHLVSSLLDFERIESAQGLQLERFSLPETIDEVIAEIKPRIAQKQLDLDLQLPGDSMPTIEADRTLLQRALYNLLDNAIRQSGRAARIEMWLSISRDSVTFAVKDKGPGIAPMDLAKVFERLGRGNGEEDTHSGMSLAIVKSIFERHGGRVWAESELGLGSTFFGKIPLEQPA
ncbi:MAG: HAMP domain-containing protein [Chloroflexi bacterium]|nr:ATP-binding protein [Chloroflexota bacterium]MQC26029.1 HAMP domain-containing protein [Chloroflexota bacterium]